MTDRYVAKEFVSESKHAQAVMENSRSATSTPVPIKTRDAAVDTLPDRGTFYIQLHLSKCTYM